MRLSKIFSLITFVTFLCVLYVYQQTEILRLAYLGQKKITVFEDLLDKNSILRYNIGRNASLVHIGNKVFKGNDLQMPDTYRLVRLTPPKNNIRLGTNNLKRENIVSRFFSIKRQAEARTISPSNTSRVDGE